jgi:probable rRNA maturation factor
LDCPEAELSIVILDDLQISTINREYRGKIGPTNVIAFAMREGAFGEISPHILGDVIISAETAHRESVDAGQNLEVRVTELLIHGILHLLGYDHEKSLEEEIRMEEKSRELMAAIPAQA